MTAAEYRRLYRQARDGFEPMTQETMSRIRLVMQQASEQVSEAVGRATRLNQSSLTRGSMEDIEMQLNRAAQAIATSTFDETGNLISSAYSTYGDVDTEYLSESIQLTDAQSRITVAGVRNMVVGVNRQLLADLVTRTYQDGYTFSDRVFLDMIPRTFRGREVLTPGGIFGDYQFRVRNLINTGVVQGRDPVQIAKDIEIYVRRSLLDAGVNTKDVVFAPGRYGRLEPGTREFARRVSGRPDWRALRLVRSELYASMQSSSVRATRINPATTDMVDWVLTPGVQHDCICIDLAAESPYHVDNVPEYPHCYIQGTEVYTKSGWKDFSDLDGDEKILSMNPKNLEYEWSGIKEIQKYRVDEDLIEMKSNSFSLITTQLHMHYAKINHRYDWINSRDIHKSSKSMIGIPRYGNWSGSTGDVHIGRYLVRRELACEFMGYYLSEGCVAKYIDRNTHFGVISQFKESSKKKMSDFFKKMPFSLTPCKSGFYFGDESVCLWLKQFGHKCWNYVIPEFIKESSSELITVFLNAFLLGDGSARVTESMVGERIIQSREKVFLTSSVRMSEGIGELIIKSGGYPSFAKQEAKKIKHRNGEYLTKHPCYLISWNNKQHSFKRRSEPWKGIKTKKIKYNGMVYDVTLQKNHILWVRHNGKTCFSGNSNCFCTIIPQLRDGNEFNRDLQRWVRGDNVGYLDTWHRETYLPAQIQST